jgi:hypothetical protein
MIGFKAIADNMGQDAGGPCGAFVSGSSRSRRRTRVSLAALVALSICSRTAEAQELKSSGRCHLGQQGRYCITAGPVKSTSVGQSGTNYTITFTNSCNQNIDIRLGCARPTVLARKTQAFTCNNPNDPNCPWEGWHEYCADVSQSSEASLDEKCAPGSFGFYRIICPGNIAWQGEPPTGGRWWHCAAIHICGREFGECTIPSWSFD